MACSDTLRFGREERAAGIARGGGGLGRRSLTGVTVLALLDHRTLTATVLDDQNAWEEEVITDAAFEQLGPHIQDLVMHPETRQLTGHFEWRVVLQRKYADGDWTPNGASITNDDRVLLPQIADGYVPGGVFADRTRLGVRIRLLLQWRTAPSGSGGAIGDKAEVSLSVALRGWT